MIAKLVVRAPTRREAIQKLRAALSEYEIVGPITNIEFLKKLCESPAFIAGNVETGYIQKHSNDLFAWIPPKDDLFAQAALGILMQEIADGKADGVFGSLGATTGLSSPLQRRLVPFIQPPFSGTGAVVQTVVEVSQIGPTHFDIKVNDSFYANVNCQYEPSSRVLTSFFPHARLSATIVRTDKSVCIFQKGRQYRLECVLPNWVEKVLGVKDVANIVVSPVPCKVLRVEVRGGDRVVKDQALVVVESMKMEMVIRSPRDGIISRVVHQEGVGAPAECASWNHS
jgi:3-methylcrotonyl-CoA carboxylase alpha subunit